MGFRCRFKYRACGYFPPEIEHVVKSSDDCIVLTEPLKVNNTVPDPSEFDLGVLLKAGVPIKQVNTKVITSTLADVVDYTDRVSESLDKSQTVDNNVQTLDNSPNKE